MLKWASKYTRKVFSDGSAQEKAGKVKDFFEDYYPNWYFAVAVFGGSGRITSGQTISDAPAVVSNADYKMVPE